MEGKKLYSPGYIKEIMARHGFSFTKSLGQNFLIDGNIVRNISELGEITKEDYVLEVGPGIGTLTEELASKAKKVVGVELDRGLLPILDETLEGHDNVEIIHGDILEVDIERIIEEKLGGGPIKVVANLPYYVTTPIIARLIEEDLNIESIIVMVQKEVGDRIVAGPGSKEYGSLSVFVNFYTDPEVGIRVPRTVFMPQPNVDSSVMKLLVKENLPDVNREMFFKIVKAGFGKRRKTVLNALHNSELGFEKDTIRYALEKAEIPFNERAENLSIEEFIRISDAMPNLNN